MYLALMLGSLFSNLCADEVKEAVKRSVEGGDSVTFSCDVPTYELERVYIVCHASDGAEYRYRLDAAKKGDSVTFNCDTYGCEEINEN